MSTSEAAPEGATKLCHIVKRADFDGYGFNLHSEKVKPGQYIGKVDADSPAEAAGLREGDRILEVNGVPIANATHKQVVQRIKAIANEVRLLLVGEPNAAKEAVDNGVDAGSTPQGTKSEMPGMSANISSISVVATKRASVASSGSSRPNSPGSAGSRDELDRAASHQNGGVAGTESNNNNVKTPPATPTRTSSAANGIPVPPPVVPPPASPPRQDPNANTLSAGDRPPTSPNASHQQSEPPTAAPAKKPGGLQLPTTAAEMRAKLMSKKKYDPKSEGVDLKKKFDIIQKL